MPSQTSYPRWEWGREWVTRKQLTQDTRSEPLSTSVPPGPDERRNPSVCQFTYNDTSPNDYSLTSVTQRFMLSSVSDPRLTPVDRLLRTPPIIIDE